MLLFRILSIDLVKPKKGTTTETLGWVWGLGGGEGVGLSCGSWDRILLGGWVAVCPESPIPLN